MIPYFEVKKLMSALEKPNYEGQSIQRYLKIAWGHSQDNKQAVAQKRSRRTRRASRAGIWASRCLC